VLAARRVGIKEVILPRQNGKNVNEDLTPELRKDIVVHLVATIDEVLALALQPLSTDARPKASDSKEPRGSKDPKDPKRTPSIAARP
jgi:ATP-dependent Lon protease